jgi:hypothetical protein
MTHRLGVAASHDIAARWCALAEQRLEYLTEMFESGRWRRYYSEFAFLENIKEAKAAVETWRGLSAPASIEAPPAAALALSVPRDEPRRYRIEPHVPPPPPIEILDAAPDRRAFPDVMPPEPAIDFLALKRILDVPDVSFDLSAIEQRYPLLRNTL